MNLEECRARIGGTVTYRDFGREPEYGVITSVSDRFAFVRYGSDLNAKATSPELLTLAEAAEVTG